jgi:hypothetical protein
MRSADYPHPSSLAAPAGPSGGGAAKAEVQEAVRRLSEAAKDVF